MVTLEAQLLIIVLNLILTLVQTRVMGI